MCGHRPAEAGLTGGSCQFMAQGAWGRVPTLAPGGSCWLCVAGGGYADFRFLGGEQPPVAKSKRPHRAVEPPQGRGGGKGGFSPQSPPGPLAPPPDGRGGAAWWFRSQEPAANGGGAHSSPAPLHPLGAGPLCRPSLRPPAHLAVTARCRLAGGGGGAGRVLGAAVWVSGQRLAGCAALGLPSRSLPLPSLPLEVARAPPPRLTVGGVWVGGPGPAGRGVLRHCPLHHPSRSSPGPAGRGRHLRRPLRGGWGCGGGIRRR